MRCERAQRLYRDRARATAVASNGIQRPILEQTERTRGRNREKRIRRPLGVVAFRHAFFRGKVFQKTRFEFEHAVRYCILEYAFSFHFDSLSIAVALSSFRALRFDDAIGAHVC